MFGEPSFDITPNASLTSVSAAVATTASGHFVARADMTEALPLLARRLRDPKILDGAEWLPDSGNTGPNKLPISFTPAP